MGFGQRGSSSGRWREALACGVVVALAAALRFFRIDAQSLWFDEGISVYHLQRSFVEVVQATAGDTHPPLYYWTLKLWAGVFGSSELGLRSLSAVCGVGVVGLTWLLGRRLFGPGPATLGALLLALSPLAVYYSQEVRMYTLVALLALLAVHLALRWLWAGRSRQSTVDSRQSLNLAPRLSAVNCQLSTRSGSLALYVLAAAATLYTQYLGAAVLAALNLYVLGALVRQPRRALVWLVAQGVVTLLFLPWLPVLLDQSQHRTLNTSPRTLPNLLLQTATALTLGRDAEASGLQPAVAALWGLALLGLAGALWRRRWEAGLPALLTVLPIGAVIALGLRSGLFELRYLSLALPGLALLAGLGLARLGQLRPRAAGALAAALALGLVVVPTAAALARASFDPSTFRDDYRGAAEYVHERLRPGDAIVLNAGNQWEVFSFYYRGDTPVYRLPAWRPIDLADTRQRLEELRQRHQRVWMLLWASREGDPTGFIEDWFGRNAFQSYHAWHQTLQLLLFSFADAGAEPRQRLDARLSNGAHLLGYTLASDRLQPGDTLQLTLFWQADAPLAERFKVFTHLLDARQVAAQRDSEPVGALRPTTTWNAGEVVVDNYGILLPPDLSPGRYALEVGMYRPADGVRPAIANSAGQPLGDHLVLAQVEVQ